MWTTPRERLRRCANHASAKKSSVTRTTVTCEQMSCSPLQERKYATNRQSADPPRESNRRFAARICEDLVTLQVNGTSPACNHRRDRWRTLDLTQRFRTPTFWGPRRIARCWLQTINARPQFRAWRLPSLCIFLLSHESQRTRFTTVPRDTPYRGAPGEPLS